MNINILINEEIEKLNINNEIEEGWGQNLAAGAMMGAASLLPMKANAQQQNLAANTRPNTEINQNSQKQVYAFMVGVASESSSLAMQNGNIDGAGAFVEIAKHYEKLREGQSALPLSINAKKYLNTLNNMSKTLDKDSVNKFIQLGMNIHHR